VGRAGIWTPWASSTSLRYIRKEDSP
jgi:hypothetical protein